jgi:hypothetical protein
MKADIQKLIERLKQENQERNTKMSSPNIIRRLETLLK